MSNATAILLAAGKSTRMQSAMPKVLHPVCGRPMLHYVLEACREAGVTRLLVVVGHGRDQVIDAFADAGDITWVDQTEQHGTAHAALMCRPHLLDSADDSAPDGPVLVIAGDMPLIRGETLAALLAESNRSGDALTLATSRIADPSGYGRIIRDAEGRLTGIVEDRDCTPAQRGTDECNVSYYCFAGRHFVSLLEGIDNDNDKGEYYITDAVGLALQRGIGAAAITAVPAEDALGINSRADLAMVNRVMQRRILAAWMKRQVTIIDPDTTWIESGARIGAETVVHPFSFVGCEAVIGEACRIGPHACVSAGEVIPAGASTGPASRAGAQT